MHLIGKHKSPESYPTSNAAAALTALSNRYISNGGAPAAFSSAVLHTVGAVNVTRRASGIFLVTAQVPIVLADDDPSVGWVAAAGPGSAVGGVASGDWLIDDGTLVAPATTVNFSTNGFIVAAGSLSLTVTLVGANPTPLAAGISCIAIQAATADPSQITPSAFFATAIELP